MHKKCGFTLVELSIVLVILGLLVGGVLTGQSLIRAAELRSITTQRNQYSTAIHAFRDKYFALPGDMANAQSFWGVAHATPATCITTVGTGTQTCNGSGDGIIASTNSYEAFRFWQHLANAGLIEGSYTGVSGAMTNRYAVIGQNIPAAKLSRTGFSVYYPGTSLVAHPSRFAIEAGRHQFDFGAQTEPWGGYETYAPAILPEEVWNVDTKLDDGVPGYGIVSAWKNGSEMGQCTTTTDPATSRYNLTLATKACAIIFILDF